MPEFAAGSLPTNSCTVRLPIRGRKTGFTSVPPESDGSGKMTVPTSDIRNSRSDVLRSGSCCSACHVTLPYGCLAARLESDAVAVLIVCAACAELFPVFVQASVISEYRFVNGPSVSAKFACSFFHATGVTALTMPSAAWHESMFIRLTSRAMVCSDCMTLSQVGQRFWRASLNA